VFIELTEFLRCPKDHEETHAVCLSLEMEGRAVVRGVLGCPVCRAEYAIVDGVVDFADTRTRGHADAPVPSSAGTRVSPSAGTLTAESLATILDLRGPGGFLLLAGAAARLGADLAALVPDVHVVCVNAPEGAVRTPGCTFLRTPGRLPLTTSSMRAVVLGAAAVEPWLAEGVRVLLRGLRLVVEDERASPAGVAELARGAGLFVGEKRDR